LTSQALLSKKKQLTDNGIKFLSGDTDSDFSFFQISELKYRKEKLRKDAEAEEKKIIPRFE
jgi:hypothetical protein